MNDSARTLVVVVTGVSGAGRSTAVRALEDLGFFCVDNLPPPVMKSTLEAFATAGVRQIAIGIDIRVRDFLDAASAALQSLQVPGERDLSVLFLDASDETLLRRFSSTRRPHPLSTTVEPGGERGATALLDGIRIERELLMPLRSRATLVLDTTRLSVHDLRREVTAYFGPGAGRAPHMRTRFVSFGFKFGTPVDADMLFDVRFLDNPYFVPELRELSGSTQIVKDFVLAQPDSRGFLDRVASLLDFCLPRFEREGKSYLTVAIGCTGGRHRSVVITEELGALLRKREGVSIDVLHRDIDRVRMMGPGADPDHSTAPHHLIGAVIP